MTTPGTGYALDAGAALEHLDMGGGSVLSLKVTGQQSRDLVTIVEGTLLEGGPPLHVHDREDEVVTVLEGELSYRLGDETGTLSPGGTLWFPRGFPQAVANLAGGPCRFLTVVTPSGSRTSSADNATIWHPSRPTLHPTQADSRRSLERRPGE